ncbi:hypothetical protein BE221DRAFT_64105 [Ostreococcus tauri]|uniref:Uncharacterized protein n=1 Tax=Ostreococcus tauri TaxID=70448 RepID=A0A1Y5I1N4_OSTTA|nr:hypothetical protein BE221DRAFT_64105 [Ostreococcus tauri]
MTQDGVSKGTPACVFTLYKFRQVFATRDMCARITRRRGSEDIHPVSVAYDGHSDVLTQFLALWYSTPSSQETTSKPYLNPT